MSSWNASYFFVVAASVVVNMLLLGVGREFGLAKGRIWGRAHPARLFVELLLISFIFFIPQIYGVSRGVVVGLAPAFWLTIILTPLWAAVRLANPIQLPTAELRHDIWRGLLALGAAVFVPWAAISLAGRVEMLFVVSVVAGVLFLFLFLRWVVEIFAFVASSSGGQRYRRISLTGVRLKPAVTFLILTGLGLWLVAYGLYFNRSTHPEWFFVAPYSDALGVLPHAKPLASIVIGSLLPVSILLIALFLVRSSDVAGSITAALLGGLCGIGLLEVFPRFGGAYLWSIQLAAILAIVPVSVQFYVDFSMMGPYTDHRAKLRRRILLTMYAFYAIFLPFYLYFNLGFDVPPNSRSMPGGTVNATVLSLSILPAPLVWILGWYACWRLYRHIPRGYGVPAFEGCDWQGLVEGALRVQAYASSSERGPVLLLASGVTLSCLSFLGWYLILVPAAGKVGVLLWIGNKIPFTVFFGFLAAAVIRFGLFDIGFARVRAFLWLMLSSIVVFLVASANSLIEGKLSLLLGGVAVAWGILSVWEPFVLPRLHRRLWPEKWEWHKRIASVEDLLRNSNGEDRGHILTDIVPPGTLAAWLLERSNTSDPPVFKVMEIAHSSGCEGGCRLCFWAHFGSADNSGVISLPGDLEAILRNAGSRSTGRVIFVDDLRIRWEAGSRSSKVSRVFFELIESIFKKMSRRVPISSETWLKLREARIALLAPLAGKSLVSVYMVSSSRAGDFFDKADRRILDSISDKLSLVDLRQRNR